MLRTALPFGFGKAWHTLFAASAFIRRALLVLPCTSFRCSISFALLQTILCVHFSTVQSNRSQYLCSPARRFAAFQAHPYIASLIPSVCSSCECALHCLPVGLHPSSFSQQIATRALNSVVPPSFRFTARGFVTKALGTLCFFWPQALLYNLYDFFCHWLSVDCTIE